MEENGLETNVNSSDPGSDGERGYLAARDSLELQLVQIWEDLLACHPIGLNDDFFDLGGDSILAMSLLARIVQQTGRNLPIAGLMRAATIKRLATSLREENGGGAWSPIVPLQTEGSKPAFFCIHPAGGNALCYLQISRLLGKDQPFYGLQAPGIEAGREPLGTIEDMAAEYVEAIRQVQPRGPYQLGGWSCGGVLAYEIAQMLRAAGEEIRLLVIMDSGVLYAFAVMRTGLPESDLGVFDVLRLPVAEQISEFRTRTKAARLVPEEADDDLAERIFHLFVANTKAMISYRPEPYAGKLTLFQASEKFVRTRHEPYHEWSQLCDDVELHKVPGNHLTLVQEPHVHELAAKLAACIDASA
jgi:thioesterase domain-containing protein/aryl carrier-like protein